MLVEWSKNIEIGVDFVDADHKVLINLLNQINDCVEQNEESTVVGSVLDALVEYTNFHFMREERMLKSCGYPGFGDHQRIHQALSQQVLKISAEYQTDPWTVNPEDVLAFLKSWLVDHIMGHDFAYRDACVGNVAAVNVGNEVPFFENSHQSPFSDWASLNILLVDDNPNFRKLIKTLLKAIGVRNLQMVDNANEGISRLAHRPTDVVLCDMVMDGMSGIDFARQVQGMELATRVVMMTGFSADEMRDRSSGMGISDFLEKPIRAKNLLDTIARAAYI